MSSKNIYCRLKFDGQELSFLTREFFNCGELAKQKNEAATSLDEKAFYKGVDEWCKNKSSIFSKQKPQDGISFSESDFVKFRGFVGSIRRSKSQDGNSEHPDEIAMLDRLDAVFNKILVSDTSQDVDESDFSQDADPD